MKRINYYLLTVITCLISSFVIAQEEEFTLVLNQDTEPLECSRRMSNDLNRQFQKSFSDNVVFVNNSGINTLSIKSEVLSTNLLEGIDTYYFAKLETTISIKSNINSLEKTITVQSEAKGKNECDAQRKAFLKSVKGKNKAKVYELLKAYSEENFTSFCTSISEKASELMRAEKFQEALSLLNAIPEESECSSTLFSLRDNIVMEIANANCKKEMHELTLIVNSGEINLVKRNIYRLLRIPPNAPCADEAIELSKKIGELMKANNKSSKELKEFNLYILEKNESSWRNRYIRSSKS